MNKLIILIVLISMIVQSSHGQSDAGSSVSKILDKFFDSGYDRRVRPNYAESPVEVGVTMYVISISSISETKQDFTVDFYFRQTWIDPRLTFEPLPGINYIAAGAEVAERIWVPDTFFANEKSAYFHIATRPNTFLRIGPKGDVLRSIRMTVTASCAMDLSYFPFDSQICSIEIESYGYSTSDITYKWAKGNRSIGLDEGLSLPNFRIDGHTQLEKWIALSTGNYSRLVAEIKFTRSFDCIEIYIPAILIVITSWISFWLDRKATTARVILGVLSVLAILVLLVYGHFTPQTTLLDIFTGACFVFVLTSLLEFSTVGYVGKKLKARAGEEDRKAILGVSPSNLDKFSRIGFPIAFIFFNLIYWISCSVISDFEIEELIPLGE